MPPEFPARRFLCICDRDPCATVDVTRMQCHATRAPPQKCCTPPRHAMLTARPAAAWYLKEMRTGEKECKTRNSVTDRTQHCALPATLASGSHSPQAAIRCWSTSPPLHLSLHPLASRCAAGAATCQSKALQTPRRAARQHTQQAQRCHCHPEWLCRAPGAATWPAVLSPVAQHAVYGAKAAAGEPGAAALIAASSPTCCSS